MNNTLKKIGTFIYYLTGIGILAFIIFSIGINNIIITLSHVNVNYISAAIIITIISSVIRIYKIGLLLNNHSQAEVFDLFVFSRVAKELSFAGYFFPVAKKNNRNISTVKNLIIDRYTEIFSTILIGFISLGFIIQPTFLYLVLFLLLGGTIAVFIIIPFVNTVRFSNYFKNKYLLKFIEIISSIQSQVNILKYKTLLIYLLSIVATCLDFLTAYILLLALNLKINFLIIPVVWAASGLMSIVGFMIIGTTEISVIFLYDKLANINTAITASFIFVSRLINILALLILLLINFIILGFNKVKESRVKAL